MNFDKTPEYQDMKREQAKQRVALWERHFEALREAPLRALKAEQAAKLQAAVNCYNSQTNHHIGE